MALNERRDRDGMTGGAPGGPRGCPDAERLAEYADGLLDAPARAAIEAHLVTCADCRFALVETMAFLGEEAAPAATAASSAVPAATPEVQVQPAASAESTSSDASARVVPFRSRRWVIGLGAPLAAAAALVLVVRATEPVWLPSWLTGGPPVEGLVLALDHQRVRPVEGRLMTWSRLAYKPPPSPTRGGNDRMGRGWSPEVGIATANIEKYAESSTSVNARMALGVALIVDGDLDRAVTELEAAARELGTMQPNPMVHTNLSAAYLARARWGNHREDWSKALAAADQAIAIEMNVLEPHFNRALALEGLGQTERAAKAWEAYIALDPDSGWTREAEARRKALSAQQP